MAIDLHAHWIPKGLSAALRSRKTAPMIERRADGKEWLVAKIQNPLEDDFDDISGRLTEMDRNGITRGVLSLTTVWGVEALPLEESLPLCRAFNDSASELCAKYPDRFSAFAAVPNVDMNIAVQEFDRAMKLPGMVGALLPGDVFLSEKKAARIRPLMEAANRHHAVILVHYGEIADDDRAKVDTSDNGLARMGTLDMQAKLSSNMVTFCLTDYLKPFPNVTMLSHNLGGNIPFEIERMDHRALIARPNDEVPSARFRRMNMYVDCNSFGARGIELAVGLYGADKIVFGTDGTDFGMKWSVDAVADACISDAEKKAILYGNAEKILSRFIRQGVAAAAE
jgi:predicted TIM-barrel fold metal-dependent hydrolase